MTQSEWLEYWLSRAPRLSDESLGDIRDALLSAEEEED